MARCRKAYGFYIFAQIQVCEGKTCHDNIYIFLDHNAQKKKKYGYIGRVSMDTLCAHTYSFKVFENYFGPFAEQNDQEFSFLF